MSISLICTHKLADMNKPHRLFDCIDQQLAKGGVEGMLVAKEGGQWRKYSTREVKDIVELAKRPS